ncbi:MAG: aminoglycoside phosphotransferase family protein [Chloroflexota bacterium]|nr:aminoglycoside phosphotransferase family protein [Chloroflexota bacterium]
MLPSIRVESWEDWTRIYRDVSVWRGLIDAICARERIGYGQLRAASENTNAVFLLDRAFALKIYSPFWDEFELERRLLEALSSKEQIPASELVGCGRIADGAGVSWPYVITRYCEARPFSEIREELPEHDAASLAAQLGRIVRRLHSLDVGRFANAATARAWDDVVLERRRSSVSELPAAGVLGDNLESSVEAMLDDAIAAERPASRVVVHGDLGADHVLCSPSDGGWRIEALIDFGDAKIGVREYEWMPVWMGFCAGDPTLARAFLGAYDPSLLDDRGFPMRAVAWTLLHDFGADELIRQWRELGRTGPIETVEEFLALLCPASIVG